VKKVVIDPNVLVSGHLFGGHPGELITLWKERRIQPLSSRVEYVFSQEVLPWFEVIMVKLGQPFVIDDPSDDNFIWCALEGRAEAIISSDHHLLRLISCPVPIFSPSEFLRAI